MRVPEHGHRAIGQLISPGFRASRLSHPSQPRVRSAVPGPAETSARRRNLALMDGDAAGPPGRTAGPAGRTGSLPGDAASPRPGWEFLARSVRGQVRHLSAPPPGGRGLCAACRIPVRPGNVRCYQCGQHAETLPGLLADVVVPICYAAKGGEHARNLWLYKSVQPGAGLAQAALRALLIVFLRDHGQCVWRSAGMTRPTHLAVVPSGRGRAGPHPLQALAGPCLAVPWVSLGLRSRDEPGIRDLDAGRFSAAPAAGADVALLDDTWTTGASAQSACAALRLAGARSVAVIVLGRHVSVPEPAGGRPQPEAGQPEPGGGVAARQLAAMPFRPWLCAVHVHADENGQ
jgi:hypothetical protein